MLGMEDLLYLSVIAFITTNCWQSLFKVTQQDKKSGIAVYRTGVVISSCTDFQKLA